MWYAPKPLGEMVEAAGIKGHKLIGLQSLGASRTIQHWNLPDDKNQAKKGLIRLKRTWIREGRGS
jgi:hypothetical protein